GVATAQHRAAPSCARWPANSISHLERRALKSSNREIWPRWNPAQRPNAGPPPGHRLATRRAKPNRAANGFRGLNALAVFLAAPPLEPARSDNFFLHSFF